MSLKEKIILFGAGHYGRHAYLRFQNLKEIICIADNRPDAVDGSQFAVPVIAADRIRDYYTSETDIIICTKYYSAISMQLSEMGIHSFYVMLEGFLYHIDSEEIMMPVEIENHVYYKKADSAKAILFLQNAACIRTHKTAMLMKKAGYHVCLVYTLVPPMNEYREFCEVYDHVCGFTSANGIRDYIENSDFDIVHCSNEPDILVTIAQLTSKPVVFDTHDMQSIRNNMDMNGLALEYVANVFSDGNIYASEGVREIAEMKYNLQGHDIFVLENMVYDQVDVQRPLQKLSLEDGEIHCVYEGGITGELKDNHRYFQEIWMKIAAQGVHIHFYSQQNYTYCKQLEKMSPYLHFEGNVGGTKLIDEMTQYDLGLVLFNVNEQNRIHLEKTTANKIYEYLNSGLPIIVGDIKSHIEFVNKYKVGIKLNLDGNIREQLKNAMKINIAPDFLKTHKMTICSRMEDMTIFYETVMEHHKEKTVEKSNNLGMRKYR